MNRPAGDTFMTVSAFCVPDPLSPAIVRPRPHVVAVLAQSTHEAGEDGRASLAWAWALTGTQPSPITLSLAPGRPPSHDELIAEADADSHGSTAPPGVPSDYCDQIGDARRILAWLAGTSDEIPLDDDQRGRFVGAWDDYARTDAEIRQVRDAAARGLAAFDLPETIDPADSANPWRWPHEWMNAAWQRGVRDLLDWVLGQRPDDLLAGRAVELSAYYDLTYEESAASAVAVQGAPGGPLVDLTTYPPPQQGEAIRATIAWLRGESSESPIDQQGNGPYTRRPRGRSGEIGLRSFDRPFDR